MDKNNFYLLEIEKVIEEFSKYGLKAVAGGGFAIDGFLGRITREHEDLDFDIVGTLNWREGFKKTENILKVIYGNKLAVKDRRFEVKLGKYRVDFEYVQDNSSENNYLYQFGDGGYKVPIPFYLYRGGTLGKLIFDIENPYYIFAIKYLMPISGQKEIRQKDKKDIESLYTKLNKEDLIKVLHFQLDYINNQLKK
jgi:hypothetical protein